MSGSSDLIDSNHRNLFNSGLEMKQIKNDLKATAKTGLLDLKLHGSTIITNFYSNM